MSHEEIGYSPPAFSLDLSDRKHPHEARYNVQLWKNEIRDEMEGIERLGFAGQIAHLMGSLETQLLNDTDQDTIPSPLLPIFSHDTSAVSVSKASSSPGSPLGYTAALVSPRHPNVPSGPNWQTDYKCRLPSGQMTPLVEMPPASNVAQFLMKSAGFPEEAIIDQLSPLSTNPNGTVIFDAYGVQFMIKSNHHHLDSLWATGFIPKDTNYSESIQESIVTL